MAKFSGLSKDIGHAKRGRVGVLLLNLGTPDAPTASAVRRYLAEFLSDPRVVEIPKLIWMLILHGIILRVRPAKSAALYEKVWTQAGSPLMDISLRQTAKLTDKLASEGIDVSVHLAMRYGNPSVASTLQNMHKQGVDKIVVLPLYPQYAAPTTGSAFDAIAKELSQWRYIPSLHFINTYHDHPDFIEALAESIRVDFENQGKPEKLVLSYHGMPERNLHLGDPYYCFCAKTTRLVTEKLGLSQDEFVMTFQSRFGKAKWLQPYTDATMQALPNAGVRDVAIVCPAFSADCLETLEEIVGENGYIFTEAGGNKFRYIPALNDDDAHITMMANLVRPYL
ncbi:ferrochelatase [Shewanella sp. JNE10-2]|uniref:ferrochelatase n=1 Tax=unclassified Shewanella TaxID=196818 RepID=UPI00200664A6|nr:MULTISPECIES: ferrochelatase [unclassified Shewanella]MCK7629628.1 ferrochelatase [Shewanella sp. JNE9-1]MCK7632936.1 ferrochelatase [Shewanella sp. JNE17]MCK7644798.1 ferrochelatase [Shewanella sp. JNE3-1]MCK7647562.1 ferrochelatase [Shewanella sp. JNE8]MCK7652931.1 ferrochelatase [Shewanella sp. JNE4-1]